MSKRKLLTVILVAFVTTLMLACAIIFTACGNLETPDDGQNTEQGGKNPDDGDEPGTTPGTDPDDDKGIAVTSLLLDKTSLTLEVGENYTLVVTVSPSNATDKSVTWSSTNSSVATVSSGKVTAKSEGTTMIAAEAHNGKTATCIVTVNEPASEVIEATSVSFNKTSLTLEIGESETLTATILPNNAMDKTVTWTSSDQAVAMVANGKITAIGSGNATITATTSNGKTATCTVTVSDPYADFTFQPYSSMDGYALTNYNGTNPIVTVPSMYNGKPVVAISRLYTTEGFYSNTVIKQVTLPESVKFINSYAFAYCTALESVTIPNCQSIESNAFLRCTSLREISFPNCLSVENYAFKDCISLQEIIFPETCLEIGDWVLSGCNNLVSLTINDISSGYGLCTYFDSYSNSDVPETLKRIVVRGGKSITEYAFENLNLEEVVLSDSIREIRDGAFYGCRSLRSFKFPGELKYIGDSAFAYCAEMIDCNLPETIESIGSSAFEGCTKITSINIPDKVKYIGNSAFSDCINLNQISFGNSIESIYDWAFKNCSSLKTIEIPDSVTYLGVGAFNGCNQLEEIILPFVGKNNVYDDTPYGVFGIIFGGEKSQKQETIPGAIYQFTYKEEYYYYYIPTTLRKITINGGVITSASFANLKFITEVTLGKNVTKIESKAFNRCLSLVNLKLLPGSLKEIETSAFYECRALQQVVIPSGVEILGGSIFSLCAELKTLKIPASVIKIGNFLCLDCHNVKIYCESERKPTNWNSYWNVYTYKGLSTSGSSIISIKDPKYVSVTWGVTF